VARKSGKIFGQTICKLRAEANLTQEKLAEKADISRRYIQMIEAGRYVPTIEIAARLRAALKTPWDVILRGL
jgi:transcriptional regulator with XRE-family HTH domain